MPRIFKFFGQRSTQTKFEENYENMFKRESLAADDANNSSKGCCSCFSDVNNKIPADYKQIIAWIGILTVMQASQPDFDKKIMIYALQASRDFARGDKANNPVAAGTLNQLITETANAAQLDMTIPSDYPALEAFCKEKVIAIPQSIERIINPSPTLAPTT